MKSKAEHKCCPAAAMFLAARRARSYADRYRWRFVVDDAKALVTYCPWCGLNLEEARRAESRPHLVDERGHKS